MTRPNLDEHFRHAGRWYRVAAIHEHGLVGTLASVNGAPRRANEIICLRLEDYAGPMQRDIFDAPAELHA